MDATNIRMPTSLANMEINLEFIEEYAKRAKELAKLPMFSAINRELDKNGCYRY